MSGNANKLANAVAGVNLPPVQIQVSSPAPLPRAANTETVMKDRKSGWKEFLKFEFMTQDEFASLLRCHPRTLQRRAESESGFPKPVKPAGRWLYRRDEVTAYLRRKLAERDRMLT